MEKAVNELSQPSQKKRRREDLSVTTTTTTTTTTNNTTSSSSPSSSSNDNNNNNCKNENENIEKGRSQTDHLKIPVTPGREAEASSASFQPMIDPEQYKVLISIQNEQIEQLKRQLEDFLTTYETELEQLRSENLQLKRKLTQSTCQ